MFKALSAITAGLIVFCMNSQSVAGYHRFDVEKCLDIHRTEKGPIVWPLWTGRNSEFYPSYVQSDSTVAGAYSMAYVASNENQLIVLQPCDETENRYHVQILDRASCETVGEGLAYWQDGRLQFQSR